MAEVARESILRFRSLLPSPAVRAYTILRACYDFYGPQTWLLLYYPLLYLAQVAKRLSVLSVQREDKTRPDGKPGFEATTTSSVAILGLLVYVLLLRYCLLDSDFWKRIQSTYLHLGKPSEAEEDNPLSFAHEVLDRLLHTSVKDGLSKDEVITRQKAYGPNEIWHGRNWVFVLLRLSIGPANLPLEASTAQSLVVNLSLTVAGCCCTRNGVP